MYVRLSAFIRDTACAEYRLLTNESSMQVDTEQRAACLYVLTNVRVRVRSIELSIAAASNMFYLYSPLA